MLDLTNAFSSILFCTVLLCALVNLALYIGGPRIEPKFERPNSELPLSVQLEIEKNSKHKVVPSVPWLVNNAHVNRHALKCKSAHCIKGSPGYILTLPVLSDPTRPEKTWSQNNTWHLTARFMKTNLVKYPLATVVVVPKETPKTVKFILDIGSTTFNDMEQGIVPSVGPDNLPSPGSLDVTGNYAGSFVLHNESDHDVYFGKKAFQDTSDSGYTKDAQYWLIQASKRVLLWPGTTYWFNSQPKANRYWNAAELPDYIDNDILAASIAETIMFEYLPNL